MDTRPQWEVRAERRSQYYPLWKVLRFLETVQASKYLDSNSHQWSAAEITYVCQKTHNENDLWTQN